MAGVRIVTDSGGDIGDAVAARLGITVIPLIVRFGQQVYHDGELSLDEFWRRVEGGGEPPATSQPSVGVFEEAFARLVEAGHQVLCLTITGQHSGTYSCATTAARRFGPQVQVMDSWSLSLGQGFQVLAAAHAALQGLALGEVAQLVARVRAATRLYLVLDTIEFIRRGGRVDRLIPVLGRVTKSLRVKPVLHLVEGKLSMHGLARSYQRALNRIEHAVAGLAPVSKLAVVHARAPELARSVAGRLSERLGLPLAGIVMRETGPLLSTHAGPKVVGVAAVGGQLSPQLWPDGL